MTKRTTSKDDRSIQQKSAVLVEPAISNPQAAFSAPPYHARASHEIPKPKAWQYFQQACVTLFRAELNDPNAMEYGRSGQNQYGIDILAKRNGDPEHYVGVQCRHVVKPLTEAKILEDCRSALKIEAGLKEIIFATTAPDDVNATNAAASVARTLRAEGKELDVVLYGWQALEWIIAIHPAAYLMFCPFAIADTRPQPAESLPPSDMSQLMRMVREIHSQQTILKAHDTDTGASLSDEAEDPALHAKIDVFRDLLKEGNATRAEKGFKDLLGTVDPSTKPWAYYRIYTNLAATAIELRTEQEAADYYETAYAVRPDDPKAIANLALARLFTGRFADAMELAADALKRDSSLAYAVNYMLQAAARSDWAGEPETLIPPALKGSDEADLGLAEFLRLRNFPNWAQTAIELSDRHKDVPVFKRVRTQAILTLIVSQSGYMAGAPSGIPYSDIDTAASELKAGVEAKIKQGGTKDLAASLSNAAVLLRMTGRYAETEALLKGGLPLIEADEQLVRLLAIVQALQGRVSDGLATLDEIPDSAEGQLLGVEFASHSDTKGALRRATKIDPSSLEPAVRKMLFTTTAELAVAERDQVCFEQALAEIELLGDQVLVGLLRSRKLIAADAALDEVQAELFAALAAASGRSDLEYSTRYMLTEALMKSDLALEASRLMEGRVDLQRDSPAVQLYLRTLAVARRDEAYETVLSQLPTDVRENPRILWLDASHAWNRGDLDRAMTSVSALVGIEPANYRARLLKIEILLRTNEGAAAIEELRFSIEDQVDADIDSSVRLVSLLGHFGFKERGAKLAYRQFLSFRDSPECWLALSGIVLDVGRAPSDLWTPLKVEPDAAVDVTYEEGGSELFIIEPDPALRKIDAASWEPDHQVSQLLSGKSSGDLVELPGGRKAKIEQIRHKYVARTHEILEGYQQRFPNVAGYQKVVVDPQAPGGLEGLKKQLQSKRAWIAEATKLYTESVMPLALLGARLGVDEVEAAETLRSIGLSVKVAMGIEAERNAAATLIEAHDRSGCVLDLYTYWTAFQLSALDTLRSILGPVAVTRTTLEKLKGRRDSLAMSVADGTKFIHYEDGRIVLTETDGATVSAAHALLAAAVDWIETEGQVIAPGGNDDLPDIVLNYLRDGRQRFLDEAIVARRTGRLLVVDDLPLRDIVAQLGLSRGCWLQAVFASAVEAGTLDFHTYVKWTARLIASGQTYLAINPLAMITAFQMDETERASFPGPLLTNIGRALGGSLADPISHISVVGHFLDNVNCSKDLSRKWQSATGFILRQLIRGRSDYTQMISAVRQVLPRSRAYQSYVSDWERGHFLVRPARREYQPPVQKPPARAKARKSPRGMRT